jgi:hypothetical protein
LAVSGMMMPPAVFASAAIGSSGQTIRRRSFIWSKTARVGRN